MDKLLSKHDINVGPNAFIQKHRQIPGKKRANHQHKDESASLYILHTVRSGILRDQHILTDLKIKG